MIIKFSIVIPLYNKGREIHRALNSVLNQTYGEYEIIVVDDGSTDNGPDVVRQFSDESIRLISQANVGVSAARNRGIKAAAYEYISFLDADDEWKPGYLEVIKNLITQYPEAAAFATAYEIMDTNKSVSLPQYKAIPGAPWEGYIPSYFKSALGVPPVWTSAVTIPKFAFDIVGKFPEDIAMGEDKEVWERIAMKFKIAFSNTIGATYHLDANNRSCPRSHTIDRPRPFIKLGKDAINNGDIPADIAKDFKKYLAVCQLQRSRFFILHLEKPVNARSILLDTRPYGLEHQLEKYLLLLLTFTPSSIIKLLRRIRPRQRIKSAIS